MMVNTKNLIEIRQLYQILLLLLADTGKNAASNFTSCGIKYKASIQRQISAGSLILAAS